MDRTSRKWSAPNGDRRPRAAAANRRGMAPLTGRPANVSWRTPHLACSCGSGWPGCGADRDWPAACCAWCSPSKTLCLPDDFVKGVIVLFLNLSSISQMERLHTFLLVVNGTFGPMSARLVCLVRLLQDSGPMTTTLRNHVDYGVQLTRWA